MFPPNRGFELNILLRFCPLLASYRKNGHPSITGLEAAWETFLEGNLFLAIELSPESDFGHPSPKSDIHDH